jgi:hypothetical protein
VRCAEWRCLTAVEPQSDDVSEALTKISNAVEH